jgi:hypothetical protein
MNNNILHADLFGVHFDTTKTKNTELRPMKVLEVVAQQEVVMIFYQMETGSYLSEQAQEKNILDLLSKPQHKDWWLGYPVFIHSDFVTILARRLNLILSRLDDEKDTDKKKFFYNACMDAWKEQLGCMWDERQKQFIV